MKIPRTQQYLNNCNPLLLAAVDVGDSTIILDQNLGLFDGDFASLTLSENDVFGTLQIEVLRILGPGSYHSGTGGRLYPVLRGEAETHEPGVGSYSFTTAAKVSMNVTASTLAGLRDSVGFFTSDEVSFLTTQSVSQYTPINIPNGYWLYIDDVGIIPTVVSAPTDTEVGVELRYVEQGGNTTNTDTGVLIWSDPLFSRCKAPKDTGPGAFNRGDLPITQLRFRITTAPTGAGLTVNKGVYYVKGILVESAGLIA